MIITENVRDIYCRKFCIIFIKIQDFGHLIRECSQKQQEMFHIFVFLNQYYKKFINFLFYMFANDEK